MKTVYINKYGILTLIDSNTNIKPLSKKEYKKYIRKTIFKKNNGRCFYCNCKLQNKNPKDKNYMTMDHKKPKSLGGTITMDNIIPSCNSCNVSKGSLDFEVFINKIIY